jgi:hypothetical protein
MRRFNYLIDEKNRVQEQILKEAKGNLKEYSKIIHKEVVKLRRKFKGKFQTASQGVNT